MNNIIKFILFVTAGFTVAFCLFWVLDIIFSVSLVLGIICMLIVLALGKLLLEKFF